MKDLLWCEFLKIEKLVLTTACSKEGWGLNLQIKPIVLGTVSRKIGGLVT